MSDPIAYPDALLCSPFLEGLLSWSGGTGHPVLPPKLNLLLCLQPHMKYGGSWSAHKTWRQEAKAESPFIVKDYLPQLSYVFIY